MYTVKGTTAVTVDLDKVGAKAFVVRWLRSNMGLVKFDYVDLTTKEIVRQKEVHDKDTETGVKVIEISREPADEVICAAYLVMISTGVYGGKFY